MVPPSGVFGHLVLETLVEFAADSLWHEPREREVGSEETERFRWVAKRARKLLAGMRQDLSQADIGTKREFIAFKVSCTSDARLVYTPDDYPRLEDQLEVLRNNGYVKKVLELPFADHYRMSEEFVRLLRGGE